MAKVNKAKPFSTETEVLVDVRSGEELGRNEKTLYRSLPDIDRFVVGFNSGLALLAKVGKMEARVFLTVLPMVKYDEGRFSANLRERLDISMSVGLKERSVRYAISKLVDCGLLIRYGLMDYTINPKHFWFGTLVTRAALLKTMAKAKPEPAEEFFNNDTQIQTL